MAQELCVIAGAGAGTRLAAVVGDRSWPLKHIQRARIVLHSAKRLSVAEVARRGGVSRPTVWRWQKRFAEEGVNGLLRERAPPPGKPPLPPETAARRRIKRGVIPSIVDLQAAINRYFAEHNDDPKPFTWTKSAETILAKLHRLRVPSE